MAYLRELPIRECQICGARAVVELVNRFNAPCGYYCRRHGRRALRELGPAAPSHRVAEAIVTHRRPGSW
jgi:hypothetical protein